MCVGVDLAPAAGSGTQTFHTSYTVTGGDFGVSACVCLCIGGIID